MKFLFAGLLCVLAGMPASAAPAETEFDSYWHDGHAELDGYRLQVTRYGRSRTGECVMVYVTEPFSRTQYVKVEDPTAHLGDAIQVLKLNLVRDFQTGIYDYNTMVSVFAREETLDPIKISFSSAEWCGHVHDQLLFEKQRITQTLLSYFEGESGTRELERRQDAVSGDNLFIALRGLRGPYLAPGAKRQVPFLPGAFHRRLTHRGLAWTTAEIERLAKPEKATVIAGEFLAIVYVVRTGDGRVGRFLIEDRYPHRILRWTWGSARETGTGEAIEGAETGELTGTTRLKYWELQEPGDERYRRELGLDAAPPGAAP